MMVQGLLPSIDALVYGLSDFVNVKDGQGRWIIANTVALDVFCIPLDVDYQGKTDTELAIFVPFFKDTFAGCESTEELVWENGASMRYEEIIPQPDGNVRVFDTVKVPLFHEDGSRNILVVIGRDITKHTEAHAALRESRQRYRSLFHNNPNAVFSIDLKRRFTSVNQKLEELVGYSAMELIGQPTSFLVEDDYLAASAELFASALLQESRSSEVHIRTKDNFSVQVRVYTMPILVNGEVIGVYGVLNDISAQKRAEQIIHHMAFYDPLTGLANRSLFTKTIHELLDSDLDTDESHAVLFLDLDNFKSLNDTKGHSVGDLLLKQVAYRLQTCVRSGRDMICRLGGDEFIILLPDVADKVEVTRLAQRVLDAVAMPWEIEDERIVFTGSIGIAMVSETCKDSESLIKNADIAMYDAKKHGKNNYQFYDDGLNDQVQRRFEIEKSLRKALENHEFKLMYQPQVESGSDRLTGAEALIRWHHPKRGVIPPGDFIEVAEESGLIIPIGKWVIREVCHRIRHWLDEGLPPIRISVNVSPRQFQDEGFTEYLAKTLEEAGISGEYIGIEITENVIMPDLIYAQKTILTLKKMGITIDIDDFGTGYSSFAYLMDFPVDKIKIDQSFVMDVDMDKPSAIVKSVIFLARSLGIRSIAEGVETREQRNFLLSYGCDELQGYLLHRPLQESDFVDVLRVSNLL